MPEVICQDCGARIFHENETTLKIQESIHKKFCRKKEGADYSYMHRDATHHKPMDSERDADESGKAILKR